MYSSTCEEVLRRAKSERKMWMSKDTWKLVKERRALKAKLETDNTRKHKLAAANMNNEKNRKMKRSCRRETRGGE